MEIKSFWQFKAEIMKTLAIPGMESCSPRTLRLMLSLGQDLIFAVSGGRQKPPKHILLQYAVKSLTNNVDLIQILNRCGPELSTPN